MSLPTATDMATWKEVYDLRHRFPKAPAWGQASFEGEGIVRRSSRSYVYSLVGLVSVGSACSEIHSYIAAALA